MDNFDPYYVLLAIATNSCISAKYCPILTNRTSIESYLFSFQIRYKSQFQKCTLMTGFAVQGHICF